MSYYSGQGQEEEICKTLKEPFTVKVAEGESPKADIGIRWNITNKPEGASKESVAPSDDTTNAEGLAETYLTLGDYAGIYGVDATCAECDKGSPVSFMANAVCPPVPQLYQGDYPNDPYDDRCYTIKKVIEKGKIIEVREKKTCQRDTKGNLAKGYTQWTIAEKGCALTGMSMVLDRYGISYLPPDALNQTMTTDINGYTPEAGVKRETTDVITGLQITYVDNENNRGLNLPPSSRQKTGLYLV